MIAARAMCLASTVNTEHLRSQLDQLHSEAETTRRKANNTRFRLLRLSEAAEQLCRQAAKSIQVGKENEARELLLQKKKIMQALEKSKGRVEVLDELAAKLNEAISIKEAHLVRNISSDLGFGGDDAGSPVRIVSPTQDIKQSLDGDSYVTPNNHDVLKDLDLVSSIDNETKMRSYSEAKDIKVFDNIVNENATSMLSSFRGVSSYIDYLEHVDRQLNKIEEELVTILELSTLVLENEEKPNNSRVQQLFEILQNIRHTRVRIEDFMQKNVKTS